MGNSKKLPASFTIEASYIFWIVLFSVAFVIRIAWQERDKVLTGYVIGEAGAAAAHIEEQYDPEGKSTDKIGKYVKQRLSGIPGLCNADVIVESDHKHAESSVSTGSIDKSIRQKISNPEGWMRMTTLFEEIKERIEKNDKTESE